MKQTVVGVFDRIEAAREAADSLGASGFGEGSVHVCAATGEEAALQARAASPQDAATQAQGAHEGGVMDGLRSFFAEVFGPGDVHQQHHAEYAEAVRRGAVVVKVEVPDDARLDVAREALQSAGAIDIEERAAEWRVGGWNAGPGPREGAAAVAAQPADDATVPGAGPAGNSGRVRVYRHAAAPGGTGEALQTAPDPAAGPTPAPAGAPKVDALDLLADDHRTVRALFKDYERLVEFKAQAGERQPLAEKICVQLTVHAALEEEIFYPAAREALRPTDLVDEASVEHASARDLIERIRAMDAEDELYDATVRVLGEYIDHHLREEEGELFPAVRASRLDLGEVGLQMSDRRAELLVQFAQEMRA